MPDNRPTGFEECPDIGQCVECGDEAIGIFDDEALCQMHASTRFKDHPIETLTTEFDGSQIEVEVPSPTGWTPKSVDPTSCSWVSEDGEHVASHFWDDVQGGTTLSVDGTVIERGLSKQEAATKLSEWSANTSDIDA